MELVKQNISTAVSFDNKKDVLREVEKKLILLLRESIEKSKPITKDIILDFYIKNIKKSETYKTYGKKPHPDYRYTFQVTDYDNYKIHKYRDDYNIKTIALQWFKANLGSVIIKGKILIIPIIEIDEK